MVAYRQGKSLLGDDLYDVVYVSTSTLLLACLVLLQYCFRTHE